MSLSCTCDYMDIDDPDWWFYEPNDFSIFQKKRRKRCNSCGRLIDIGSPCLEFLRDRPPCTDIEEMIVGDDVPIASLYFCEWCGEQYFNLSDLGYCLTPEDDMIKCLKEYYELTGFRKQDVK